MALLQYRAPVDYEAQQEAFRDFLENFKSSQSMSEDTATDAIDDLNLDADRTSDEYDFMDDVIDGDGSGSRRAGRSRPAKRKYMAILQEVADRVRSNILIELDDLEEVRCEGSQSYLQDLIQASQYEKAIGDDQNLKLVDSITNNTKHYIDILSDAVDAVMPKESREITYVSKL